MKCGVFLFLLFPAVLYSQKKDTVLKYLDAWYQLTTKKNAVYYGVSIKEEDHWKLFAIYPDTTTLLKVYFKDSQLKIKDGPYYHYYPKNRIARQGFFSNNEMNGVWQTWFENGRKKDSGLMISNLMVGEWKTWYNNGAIMMQLNYAGGEPGVLNKIMSSVYGPGFVGMKDGSFRSWYSNGLNESIGQFKNDRMHGTWKWYHENGLPSTIEEYIEGKLLSIECFDTTGNQTGDFCPVSRPAVLQEYGDYKQFIYQNLHWPEEALKKRIEGEVKVRFRINKKGELENLVLETDKEILRKAVQELFEQMKAWYPAVSHNRLADWEEEMTIPFYLDHNQEIDQ